MRPLRYYVRLALITATVMAVAIGALWLFTDGPHHTTHEIMTRHGSR